MDNMSPQHHQDRLSQSAGQSDNGRVAIVDIVHNLPCCCSMKKHEPSFVKCPNYFGFQILLIFSSPGVPTNPAIVVSKMKE